MARRVGFDPANTVILTPDVVRAEIRKTYNYTDSLHEEILAAYGADSQAGKLTAEKTSFFSQWAKWKGTFNAWADDNLNDPWSPNQLIGMKAINNQNNQYRIEAEDYQKTFRELGYKSNAKPPSKSPGLRKPSNGFLAGLGLGGLLALGGLAFVLLSGKGSR